MGIDVEILIRAPVETLWAHTQTPELHERWDLRFSRIDYRTRFGAVGALLDRLGFQPLMGWATAWSFDRLRL